MLSFTVRLKFDQEHHDQVAEMLRPLSLASRQEPGCISYVAHFIEDDPTTVLIYEQYSDAEALESHRATPHFHQYAIGGLYQLMLNKAVENLTAVC